MARGYPQGYAATFRTFVDDISSISRGKESWVLQAQRKTSSMLLKGLKENKCKISKKIAIVATRKRLQALHAAHL
eukprot:3306158-Karenia_brevis.AAC.1